MDGIDSLKAKYLAAVAGAADEAGGGGGGAGPLGGEGGDFGLWFASAHWARRARFRP